MDVLRPSLVWIGNRCYRKNAIIQTETQLYVEEEESCFDTDVYRDESCDSNLNIQETEHGYRMAISVPSAFHKHIIGRKSETKRKIETETRTKVAVPKPGVEGDVVITGRERCGIISAKTRIEIIVDSARQRAPFTHFLSFPVAGDDFKEKFATFKEQVIETCGEDRGIDDTIFQNPLKLHLTVGTLTLMTEAEVDQATQLLNECHQNIIKPILGDEPLVVNFEGLEYMNDDPGMVDVLYAKIGLGAPRLQRVADALVAHFVSAGIMSREYERVKLHVTVINSLMRKDPSGSFAPARSGNKQGLQDRESFDAANILQLFGSYDFGRHHIDTIHLSQRYSTGEDGYYNRAASVSLL